ncbi:MAG: hypothetical protein ACHREM_17145 [Polyangiales bacterium]
MKTLHLAAAAALVATALAPEAGALTLSVAQATLTAAPVAAAPIAATPIAIGPVQIVPPPTPVRTTLYIHGRSSTPSGWGYWNHETIQGVNAVPVNYDGTAHIWQSNPTVVAALDAYCSGINSCYVVCHSAGCAQIGYAVAVYENGLQSRWNILGVAAGGSASGGSDIAGNAASFITGWAIDSDLAVGTMRGMYNHDVLGDDIAGNVNVHLGADWAWFSNPFFSGNNDTAVSFHSSGHFRGAGSYSGNWPTGAQWDHTVTNYVDPTVCTAGFWFFGWNCTTWSGNNGHCNASSWDCYEGNYGGIMALPIGGWVANNAH